VLGKLNWKDRSKNRADGENSIKESKVCSVIEERGRRRSRRSVRKMWNNNMATIGTILIRG
jgi:hypothetical protein